MTTVPEFNLEYVNSILRQFEALYCEDSATIYKMLKNRTLGQIAIEDDQLSLWMSMFEAKLKFLSEGDSSPKF